MSLVRVYFRDRGFATIDDPHSRSIVYRSFWDTRCVRRVFAGTACYVEIEQAPDRLENVTSIVPDDTALKRAEDTEHRARLLDTLDLMGVMP